MNFRLVYHELFEGDVEKIKTWYDEKEPGLASRFEAKLQVCISAIQVRQHSFQIVSVNRRRALFDQFPHLVVFQLDGELVLIAGVFHTARDRKAWESRT